MCPEEGAKQERDDLILKSGNRALERIITSQNESYSSGRGAPCPQKEMHRILLCLIIPREKFSDPVENFQNDVMTGT